MGRTFAIGDIHGCDKALTTLLDHIGLTSEDTLVVLGDMIDRGPGSREVIERLLQLKQKVNLIALCGNHEEMLLQSLERGSPKMIWVGSGALATLDSYGGNLSDIPESHVHFFTSLSDFWQTETHIFVHANVDPKLAMTDQSIACLRWQHFSGEEHPHCSGKTVVCGHTGQPSGFPAICDGYICIDTQAHKGRWLTCLNVDDEILFQASQNGEFRGLLPLRKREPR